MAPPKWLVESTKRALKANTCSNCGGIYVKSYVTSLMAMKTGKRCICKQFSELSLRN